MKVLGFRVQLWFLRVVGSSCAVRVSGLCSDSLAEETTM